MPAKRVNMKIERAWCVELNKEVSITEAWRAFQALNDPNARWTFFCNTDACKGLSPRVLVSGVNYRVPAQEMDQFVTPHYRALEANHPHEKRCDWIVSNNKEVKQTDPTTRTREPRRKVTHLVTVFDPRGPSISNIKGSSPKNPLEKNEEDPAHENENSKRPRNGEREGETFTGKFDHLIDSYETALVTKSATDFQKQPIVIKGIGQTTYGKYFQHVSVSDGSGVIHGKIRDIRPYGDGFKLFFVDRNNEIPVTLYFSHKQMHAAPNQNQLKLVVNTYLEANPRPSIHAYALGKFKVRSNGSAVEIINTLPHQISLRTTE